MKLARLIAIPIIVTFSVAGRADQYGTFQTTRYYSQNQQYFLEVTEKQKAALYKNAARPKRLWMRSLPLLPRDVFLTNDGTHFAIVDSYYGNNHDSKAVVILTFDNRGNELSRYTLGEVANLSRVATTTSEAYWFGGAWFSGNSFIVQTIVTKLDWGTCLSNSKGSGNWDKCLESTGYEQLRFDLKTGKLSERTKS
jgi:hypothetical protein